MLDSGSRGCGLLSIYLSIYLFIILNPLLSVIRMVAHGVLVREEKKCDSAEVKA